MNKTVELKLKMLTESPGCYLMKHQGEIIYVGKAKNLKNRVKSYFVKNASHNIKVETMVKKIDDFDLILCNNNFEALTLECNLIKKYKPFYNILLKDDKQFPFIKINAKEAFPKFQLARRKEPTGEEFFGPFSGTLSIKEILQELSKLFPLRNCKLKLPDNTIHRPCMRYEIGLCLAPCAKLCSEEEYKEMVKQAILFLNGHINEVEKNLKLKMELCSSKLEFEKAAHYRDKLTFLKQITHKHLAIQHAYATQDVWAIVCDLQNAMLYQINIVEGKILGGKDYLIENYTERPEEILTTFLPQVYSENAVIPNEIILNTHSDDDEALEQWLQSVAKKKITLTIPKIGQKKSLANLAEKNAIEKLNKHTLIKKFNNDVKACDSLAHILNIETTLNRIEGYDISNTFGTYSVASMVVFNDGKPNKKAYRKFKIKSVEGANDFLSIYEVIYRRFNRALNELDEDEKNKTFESFPDLIIVDGGLQQLTFAQNALKALNLRINIIGLAEKNEEVYLPFRETPLIIDEHDPAFKLLQRIRNEAHRFAISYHRDLRDKGMTKSKLLSIKGIGEKKHTALLKQFKTIENIKQASIENLMTIKGITLQNAKDIKSFFGNEM